MKSISFCLSSFRLPPSSFISHFFPVTQTMGLSGFNHCPTQNLVNLMRVFDITQYGGGFAGVVTENTDVAQIESAFGHIFSDPPERTLDTEVVMTVVGGQVVYEQP